MNEQEKGLWLCKVYLAYTDKMVLRYDGHNWWQYLAPGICGELEGWIGVNFEFEPIKHLE